MGYSTKCVVFDGVDEYVNLGDVFNFERTDPFSVAFWIKHTGSGGDIIGKMANPGASTGWCVDEFGGAQLILSSNYNGGDHLYAYPTGAPSTLDGNWHHWVVTYDGSSLCSGVHFYLDGTAYPTYALHDTLTGSILTSVDTYIASRVQTPGHNHFPGYLDEIAVYTKALSAGEVTWIYNGGAPRDLMGGGAPSNLAGWWRMGEGDTFPTLKDSVASGWSNPYPTITDASGNGRSGTMVNMESGDFTTTVPGGTFTNHSVLFDGVNEYVNHGNVLSFERTDAFSFSGWINPANVSSAYYMLAKFVDSGYGGPRGYTLYISSGYIWPGWYGGSYSNALEVRTSSSVLSAGVWQHVVVTYAGTSSPAGVKIYRNGVSQSLTTTTNGLTATIQHSYPFTLAAYYRNPMSFTFPGYIDEVAAYNKALSQAEVTWLYNGGSPNDLLGGGAPSNLVGWWRMGEGAGVGHDGTMVNMESGDILDRITNVAASAALLGDASVGALGGFRLPAVADLSGDALASAAPLLKLGGRAGLLGDSAILGTAGFRYSVSADAEGDSDVLAIGLIRAPMPATVTTPLTTTQRVAVREHPSRYIVNPRPTKPREASIMDRNTGGRPERPR